MSQPTPSVLIVDDERGMREGMRRVLAARGLACETAGGADEALAAARARPFGLALVDLKMPGMDGFELIRALRELDPSMICIVVSAFATVQSAMRSTRMGASDFVAKPFEPDELMVVVNRALEQWRLAREASELRAEREAHLLELAAEKSRLRTILQAMGEGLLVINIDGDVVLDNPATHRILGTRAPSGRAPLTEVLPEPRFVEAVRRQLRGGADAHPVELEVGLGGDRFARATLAPVRSDAGAVLGVVVVLGDISDDKALERMKTRFISMVAHEVKAPIGAVEGYLQLIRDGAYDGEPEGLRAALGRCQERTSALLTLVQDLLELTRIDATPPERRFEPLDLPALAADLVAFLRPTAQARGVALELEVEPALPRVAVDRGDAERVLSNLLSNAIKYNRDGGRARLRLVRAGDRVSVEVSDTGIGMAEAERRRLGEEFFRAKNPRTRAITGTGLGVALVRRIVERYHGVLEVESTPEVGSSFRVTLPLALGVPAAAPGVPAAAPGAPAAGTEVRP